MTDGIRASAIGTGRSAGDEFPFTASQWQELEHQTLAFKYIVSGVPVPPDLISTLITTPSSSLLFPHQHQLPIGWGCFQVGYGRKIDPEPGRCRRTDGKKWRCSKEACPNSKYCEKHVNRGKSKSKKQQQQTHQPLIKPNTSSTTSSATLAIPAISSSSPAGPHDYSQRSLPSMTPSGHEATSVYPRLSARSSLTGQTQPAPQWLMDPEFYDHQANKTIRFEF